MSPNLASIGERALLFSMMAAAELQISFLERGARADVLVGDAPSAALYAEEAGVSGPRRSGVVHLEEPEHSDSRDDRNSVAQRLEAGLCQRRSLTASGARQPPSDLVGGWFVLTLSTAVASAIALALATARYHRRGAPEQQGLPKTG